jgi:hypothetical protein
MAGLVPAIHAGRLHKCREGRRGGAAWMPATSAGMTGVSDGGSWRLYREVYLTTKEAAP